MKVWQLKKATEIFEQFKNEGFVLDMWTYNEFLFWAFQGVDHEFRGRAFGDEMAQATEAEEEERKRVRNS